MTSSIDFDYLECLNYVLMALPPLEKHDLINLKGYLETILLQYNTQLANTGRHIHYLDKQLSKKWKTSDKALVALSGGLAFRSLKKTINDERSNDLSERTELEEVYTSLEEHLIPQINKMIMHVDSFLGKS